MAMALRLGHFLAGFRPTLHNGPGWRIGIWLQGCELRCTEQCLNPNFLDPEGGYLTPIEDVRQAISNIVGSSHVEVKGVTVLGGEPTEQAPALVNLLQEVRNMDLTVMLYSGYTLQTLEQRGDSEVEKLLALTDILIDGPFVQSQYDETLPWRGSKNQRIHTLSDRYTLEDLGIAFREQRKSFSVLVRPSNGIVSISGLQERAGAVALETTLKRLG